MIYKTLTPEYKDDSKIRCTSAADNDKKAIEEDSKKVAANYDIDVKEDVPDSPIYRRLQERIEMIEDERDYYRDQYYKLKEQIKLLGIELK